MGIKMTTPASRIDTLINKEKERVEYLKKSSKKVVKQYGPDYYRKVKPLIHRKNCNWCTGFNIGRLDA